MTRNLIGIVALTCVLAFASTASGRGGGLITTVTIGDGVYRAVEARDVLRQLPVGYLGVATRLTRFCKSTGIYGYVSNDFLRDKEAGLVAWVPTNPLDCLDYTTGGGAVCQYQAYRTPDNRSGQRNASYWVVIVATSQRMCAKLATQVPGGVWVSLKQSASLPNGTSLAAGTSVLVKCQRPDGPGHFRDLFVLQSGALPGNRSPYFIDGDFAGQGRLSGVPYC